MHDDDGGERHSRVEEPRVVTDPDELAQLEARNALRQFDAVCLMIEEWLQPERRFKLRASMVLQLHRAALEGLSAYAGNYRPGSVDIEGSSHQPHGAHLVPELVEEMCDYINDHWNDRTALHLSAYVMWRLNWIHPFSDGNGRTSRAVSYLVLCMKLGYKLPGTRTIPAQIADNKKPYYLTLEEADAAYKSGQVDVSALEDFLGKLLACQLMDVYESATSGKNGGENRFH
ncbi:Fic family protein [Candidatus Terasakiella magnetica]|nr:Fic family protein [Candidatus Terasakiella magnetica]